MTKKRFIGWARVSTREQEQEGFSLDVQVEGFQRWGQTNNATIDPIFVVAETASRAVERKKFKSMIAFAKRNARKYDGVLCYKFDRAARNLPDYNKLEQLESSHGLAFLSVTQPIDDSPTGRLLRLHLAGIARFQTEQQSLDVKEGIARRVAEGWFPSNPPFGYRNRRINKRSIVETHPQNGRKVTRIFDLRANHGLTAPEIVDRMFEEGLFYSDSKRKFSESKINSTLHDRSYLGFISFRGEWHPGKHEPLVDQMTWDRVQVSFDERKYLSHELVYARCLIRCGHCGHRVTGEPISKETKAGEKWYVYYRCSRYCSEGHPRVRLKERELDHQLCEMLTPLRTVSAESRGYLQMVARTILNARFQAETLQVSESSRLLSLLETQRGKLLSRNLSGSVSDELYDRQSAEFDQQEKSLKRQVARHRQINERIEEVSGQADRVIDVLANDWMKMERRARQLTLVALFGGFTLEGRTLVPDSRTPLELFRAG